MLRRLEASLVLGLSVVAIPAHAQEPESDPATEERQASPSAPSEGAPSEVAPVKPAASATAEAPPKTVAVTAETDVTVPPPAPEPESGAATPGWKIFASGYFRAPLAIGISHRTSPDDLYGAEHTQLSFGPNRTVDSNYYSFAYTRLQEQDWVELFVHAKKKHVEAVVGWMGYWFQGAGFRNPDAAWVPAAAYLALDTDFNAFGIKPNIKATVGAFWPQFGYFAQYDTYTLGRFRQIGEQLQLTVPASADIAVTATQGFGGSRDGTFVYQINPPIYGAKTGMDLIVYEHLALAYKKVLNVGLHHNSQWTMDPNLFRTTVPGKTFTDAQEAHLTTVGAEASVEVPVAGRLWVSPSYITVKNGWALANGGTEVMHSLGGDSIAANYFGWSGSLPDSTGSGSMFNLGFNYENTLSNVLGKPRTTLPDVKLSLFGLFADIKLDLPATTTITQDHVGQFKYGAAAEVQALSWLALMLRWDEVNYNLGHGGYVFSAISPRLTFSSHFLSGESIYLQYSRYRYGDEMMLAGRWPWNQVLVPGSDIIQGGPYAGQKPDMDVVRVQATVAF